MVVHSSASGGGGPGLGAHAGGSALGLYDEERARAVKRRVVLGAQAIRSSGASVRRPDKDALSNEKLAPVESGRGFALLEKRGWKKGQGLGRSNDGVMLPVEAAIKTDMGGLRAESGGANEVYGGAVASFGADGPGLVNESMSTGASSMMASLKATMDNEFSSLTTQTKTVQQINQEARERAAAGFDICRDLEQSDATVGAGNGKAAVNEVNIANFTLGRSGVGQDAIAIIYLDQAIDSNEINTLKNTGLFQQVRALKFEVNLAA